MGLPAAFAFAGKRPPSPRPSVRPSIPPFLPGRRGRVPPAPFPAPKAACEGAAGPVPLTDRAASSAAPSDSPGRVRDGQTARR